MAGEKEETERRSVGGTSALSRAEEEEPGEGRGGEGCLASYLR